MRTTNTSTIARAFARLERRAWGRKAFPLRYFERRIADPRAVVLALRSPARRVAGFLIAVPDGQVRGALYVEDTLLDVPYRGRGLVALLGQALEREARRRGFRYLTRDAKIANGYADAIERAYGDRILERHDHPSPFGPQRYLRLTLARPARPRRVSAPSSRPPRR